MARRALHEALLGPGHHAAAIGYRRRVPLDPARAALEAALLRHVPADLDEEHDRSALLALVAQDPRCFSRDAFDPGHVTGSAFIVDRGTGRVLLHHHRRLDRWLQMGGHDEGEHDPAKTALREGSEESGLDDLTLLSPDVLDVDVHEIPAARGEPAHLHFDVRYALHTERPERIRRDDAESVSLAWFTLAEAAEKMDEPGARRALARLARLHLDLG